MLEKFRQVKQAEIEALNELEKAGNLDAPVQQRPDFATALTRPDSIAVIAEYKRASPSKGVIRTDLIVEDIAASYKKAGAAAISILTEEKWFDGHMDYLARAAVITGRDFPILRKDFIFHPIQIKATAQSPASSILLITRLYKNAAELRYLRELAESLNLAAVVEIFNYHDLEMAREAGARIIQVNARDLQTLQVNRKEALALGKYAKSDEIWIAASGISKAEHLKEAREAGFNAVLIGSALMAEPDPYSALCRLLSGSF